MKLSEIDATLRRIHVRPVKTLGQNFLHDNNLARWIVDRAELQPGDFCLEIGPGLGALTEHLLDRGARILAIEKDRRLAEFLRDNFRGKKLEVIHGDALEFEVRQLYAEARVTLIANLPYYIASQLLFRFLQQPSPIHHALLMLQKEMAERLSAVPRSPAYGALSLLMQSQYHIDYLRTVPTTVFLPQPEVDSAFVRLRARKLTELPAFDRGAFERIVRAGFSQRRKQLRKLLREQIPDWSDAAATLGFDEQARAEELPLEQWIALSRWSTVAVAHAVETEASEEFAVVDDNDIVIGRAPRAKVHANNFLHRAVHILVFDSEGRLFLQKRSAWKDRHPRVWDSSAAGHVHAGEDYDETAARELEEELGIRATLTRTGKLSASAQTGYEFIRVYEARADGPFRLNAAEIEFGDFFSPELVDRWVTARPHEFAPGFIECWKLWKGNFGPSDG